MPVTSARPASSELSGAWLAHCRRWGELLPLVLAANAVAAISAWMIVNLLMK
jgi:hypothetical protein